MWFDSWSDLVRVVLVGAAAYVFLVVLLRVSGKRTLSQLNAFDFIVTVALGSTLATILLSSDVSWSEGAAALALLAGMQFLVASVTSRFPRSEKAVKARPTAILLDGRIDAPALAAHRLTEQELRQAVRGSGVGDLSLVAAVILETNGKLSVIPSEQYGDGSALTGVVGID
ncbi:DUF421 domain-containing protein [Labedella phragmitis]|uniref:DUF421 domain-containing protein n=1 Tax=Labedella phragmitis TaxID=2498849 RepID=A0A444PTI0_9MICO|nr:YetF domain-containing protein [Labedella phragmitis]RWZ51169.1 DUF421 domain-containing protein [Labedella phragmitis]